MGFKKWMSLATVVVLGVGVQALLCLAEAKDSPRKAAVEFARGYFKFDRAMAERVCGDRLIAGDKNVVDAYLERAEADARMRGFGLSCFVRENLYNVGTVVVKEGADQASVRLTGHRRSPVRGFFTGESRSVDTLISVVKEDGAWKVRGDLFELPGE